MTSSWFISNAFKIPNVARALSRREFAGFFALIILSVITGGADGTANFVMGPSAMPWQQAEDWCLALSRREFAGFFALIILSVITGGADGTANFVMGPSAMSWQQAEEWCLA